MQRHLLKPHVGSDEVSELVGRNLTKTFKSGYLRVRTEVADGLQALLLAVAVTCDEVALALLASETRVSLSHHLLVLYLRASVADAEERCLEHVDVSFLYQVGEELEEEGDDEEADVHAVHIGIGRNNHLVVTQCVESVLDVEGCLEQIELLILVYHLLGQSVRVERLASQGEHSLRVDIATLRY